MFGLFRKKRNKKPPAEWMKWFAIAIVVYALITNNNGTKPELSSKTTTDTTRTAVEPKGEVSELISNTTKLLKLDGIKGKYLPQTLKKLAVQDTLSGTGAFATCGQKATVNYAMIAKGEDNASIKDPAFSDLTFTIGDDTAPTYLNQGIVGMSKGGKRVIYTPESEIFEAKLVDISPTLPDFSAYRILGDTSETGDIYNCGMAVKLHVSIWNMAGKKLFDSKETSKENNGTPLTFTLGKSEVFLGLEQGALGMTIGSKRSLIVPPSFQKTLNANAPLIKFPLPKNQTIIVDIESVI